MSFLKLRHLLKVLTGDNLEVRVSVCLLEVGGRYNNADNTLGSRLGSPYFGERRLHDFLAVRAHGGVGA